MQTFRFATCILVRQLTQSAVFFFFLLYCFNVCKLYHWFHFSFHLILENCSRLSWPDVCLWYLLMWRTNYFKCLKNETRQKVPSKTCVSQKNEETCWCYRMFYFCARFIHAGAIGQFGPVGTSKTMESWRSLSLHARSITYWPGVHTTT
jgi:hypothetical protein